MPEKRMIKVLICGVLAGTILYVMVLGNYPYWATDKQKLGEKIISNDLDSDELAKLSPQCLYFFLFVSIFFLLVYTGQDLVRRMLTKDPKCRISIENALDHLWVRRHCGELSKKSANLPQVCYQFYPSPKLFCFVFFQQKPSKDPVESKEPPMDKAQKLRSKTPARRVAQRLFRQFDSDWIGLLGWRDWKRFVDFVLPGFKGPKV